MGHRQPATKIIIDNSTEYGIIKGTIKPPTKEMDMHFYWVRERVEHKQFDIKWKPGQMNLRDSFKNHHTPTHHQCMQQTYLLNGIIAVQEHVLQGCDKTRNTGAGKHTA